MEISKRQSNVQIFKYTASNLLSTLGGNMFSYALGLMLLSQTGSAISFALGLIINPIVNLLFLIPIGNLIDKLPHKKIPISIGLVRILALILLIISIDKFENIYKLVPIIPFLTVMAICNSISNSTYTASVHELVNDKKIQSLSSLTSAVSALATIISPIIGFNFYAIFGFETFIIFEFFISIIILLIVFTMKFYYEESVDSENIENKSQLQNFKLGLNYIKKRKLIADLIILGTFLNFIFSSTTIGIPFLLKSRFHISDGMLGYVETSIAAGILIGSLAFNFLPKNKYFKFNIIFPLLFIGTLVTFLGVMLGFFSNLLLVFLSICIIEFLIGLSLSMLEITSQVKVQSTTPTKLLGRVSSILITANNIIFPFGTMIFTLLFDHIKNGGIIYIGVGLLCIAYGLMMLPILIKNINSDDTTVDVEV